MYFRWSKEEQDKLPIKNYTFATTFSGAGGAAMGMYYLNRFKPIFNCEINKTQFDLYNANIPTKYKYNLPIQKLLTIELPIECYNIDILQESFPCSLFSSANIKADSKKGKLITIKECGGQCQIIDELYIEAIKMAAKVQPKVVIFENVKGLLYKKNYHYVKDIYKRLNDINYKVKHWVIKGEDLGLPQKRHRVFFIALRYDIDFNLDDLNLYFDEPKVYVKDLIKCHNIKPLTKQQMEVLTYFKYGDKSFVDVYKREYNKRSHFNSIINYQNNIVNSITTKAQIFIVENSGIIRRISNNELIEACSFPIDYNFLNKSITYPLGMSVPPLMMAKIVDRIEKQILSKI